MNKNPHQAGKENYTPNGHTQTLLIFYRAHSKLFHTLTLILQKKYHSYFTKRKREIFDDDFGVFFSLSGILWLFSLLSSLLSFFHFLFSLSICILIDALQLRELPPFIGVLSLELMKR